MTSSCSSTSSTIGSNIRSDVYSEYSNDINSIPEGSGAAVRAGAVSVASPVKSLEFERDKVAEEAGLAGNFCQAISHASDSSRVRGRQVTVGLRTMGAIESKSGTSTWNQRT